MVDGFSGIRDHLFGIIGSQSGFRGQGGKQSQTSSGATRIDDGQCFIRIIFLLPLQRGIVIPGKGRSDAEIQYFLKEAARCPIRLAPLMNGRLGCRNGLPFSHSAVQKFRCNTAFRIRFIPNKNITVQKGDTEHPGLRASQGAGRIRHDVNRFLLWDSFKGSGLFCKIVLGPAKHVSKFF